MADVSNGPVATMPGSHHSVPEGTKCDEHSTVPAVRRIQGETDSFGCEYYDVCQACYDKDVEDRKNRDRSGYCDWCKCHAPRVSPRRDFEEGSSGRLYDVCDACIKKESDRISEELGEAQDEWFDIHGPDDGPDDDDAWIPDPEDH